jgi:hypothetical protein
VHIAQSSDYRSQASTKQAFPLLTVPPVVHPDALFRIFAGAEPRAAVAENRRRITTLPHARRLRGGGAIVAVAARVPQQRRYTTEDARLPESSRISAGSDNGDDGTAAARALDHLLMIHREAVGEPTRVSDAALSKVAVTLRPDPGRNRPPRATRPRGWLAALRADPRQAIQQDSIRCLICGRAFRQLTNTHLRGHRTSAAEYKRRFGYNRRRPLMCRALQQLYTERAVKRGLAAQIRRRPILVEPELRRRGGTRAITLEESLTRRDVRRHTTDQNGTQPP